MNTLFAQQLPDFLDAQLHLNGTEHVRLDKHSFQLTKSGATSIDAHVAADFIGSSVSTLENVTLEDLIHTIAEWIVAMNQEDPDRKATIGVQFYVRSPLGRQYRKTLFSLKKLLRKNGQKARLVVGSSSTLTSAQIEKNQLLDDGNFLLAISGDAKQTTISQITAAQDIGQYSTYDHERPCRDTTTGMLPPRLVHTMLEAAESTHKGSVQVFDPFCGSGLVIQEAWRRNLQASGSDLNAKMVSCTQQNLEYWIGAQGTAGLQYGIAQDDAKTISLRKNTNAIVSEGYLGPAQHQSPTLEQAQKLALEAQTLYSACLKSWSRQLPQGAIIVITLPSWKIDTGETVFTEVDDVSELGYNYADSVVSIDARLEYREAKHIVGRQLVVLRKV